MRGKLFCGVASVSERRGGASKFSVWIFAKKSSDFVQRSEHNKNKDAHEERLCFYPI